MLIKTTRIYTLRQFKNCEKDFETINTFNKTGTGKHILHFKLYIDFGNLGKRKKYCI